MNEQLVDDLQVFVSQAIASFCRLALIVGPLGAGKTPILKSLASRLDVPVTNVNLELSAKLLAYPTATRPFRVVSIFEELIDGQKDPVLLDNIEVLFDPTLRIDPLRLLENLSRCRTIVATWPGTLVDNRLVYAEPWHPEYRTYSQFDAHPFCVNVNNKYK